MHSSSGGKGNCVAAQDLIISRRGQNPSSYFDGDVDSEGADGATILIGILRKRWILLFIITFVSAALALFASMQFGKESAVVKSTLIYTGFPAQTGMSGFDPLGPATGSELILSPRVLNQLRTKRQLEIGPAQLALMIKPSINRSSSLLNLTLNWADADDGIAILNDLSSLFIDEMASQRKAILREYLQHLDLSLLQAKMRTDDARQQQDGLHRKRDEQLTKGGLSGDQYRQALTDIANAKKSIDGSKAQEAGIKDQIDQITTSVAELTAKIHELEKSQADEYVNEARSVLTSARKQYSAGSNHLQQIERTIESITKLVKSDDATSDFSQWIKSFSEALLSEESGLSKDERTRLSKSFTAIKDESTSALRDVASHRRQLEDQRRQLVLNLSPIKSSIALFEQNQVEAQKRANALGEKITGITATQLDESDHRLEVAETQQDGIAMQRDNIRQLADSKLREWSVSVPASIETTQVGSNYAKLFVFVFGICGLLFSAPLFAAEWRAQLGTPQVRFARSLRVPVLAERILEHFSPKQRLGKAQSALSDEQLETVRMMTLKIQQSCHRPGSVVLFSSLDASVSAGPLMATVAECLAEREERVLLVDAVSPDRALVPVINMLTHHHDAGADEHPKKNPPLAINGHHAAHNEHPGLSEFLSEDCEAVGELIRPTGCPGVDIISSGRSGFAREAMASSCMTELLNVCRRNYTMVLVHGPAADRAADLQMLTARADGVVLATTRTTAKSAGVRELVQDLLDLGAPIIGVVA